MKFGIFYEHQIPRPWDANAEGNVTEMIIQGIFPWCFTPFCKGNDAQRASRVAIRGRV